MSPSLSFVFTTLFASLSLLLLLPSFAHTRVSSSSSSSSKGDVQWQRRTLNATIVQACKALEPSSKVYYPLSLQHTATLFRYLASTSQYPGCVFLPTEPKEIADALTLLADRKVPFAISSGRHASNKGFSSTVGVQIDMKGFQHVLLSADKSYVDIGSGNIWDNVYQTLEGSGVNIVGGRVTGVGVGGFLTGGGGYSWKTNQYGLTVDTLLQADMVLPDGSLVTASEQENPDLFWAIKGGGNQFGIVYNWRLKTVKQPTNVYGGLRTYTADQIPAVIKAIAAFNDKSTDAKAQVLPTFNTVAGIPGISLLGFYDDAAPGDALSKFFDAPATTAKTFTDGWKAQSFTDLVRSAPANATAGTRGLFHTVSLKSFSQPIIEQIANQSAYWGTRPLRSGVFISYDVEPFLSTWSQGNAKDAAYPHDNSPLPLNLYFAWTSPLDDAFYQNAAKESARLLTDLANAEGQNLAQYTLYPNYCLADTPAAAMYGSANAARLASLKKQYDPNNVMGGTTYFSFT